MNLRILDEAADEFSDAIGRYESIESGLGIRLKEEVKSVVDWIADHPELPRVRSKGYRRVNLKVFPDYIAYILHADVIWVLAVAHSARLPEYWIARSIPE
jgi:plasmid stabilization system protein ParE